MSTNYRLRKVTPRDVCITLHSIFGVENVPLIGVSPAREYLDGKPTDKILGYYYTLATNGKYINIKVLGDLRIPEELLNASNVVYVEFDNLEFTHYINNGYVALAASASDIRIL